MRQSVKRLTQSWLQMSAAPHGFACVMLLATQTTPVVLTVASVLEDKNVFHGLEKSVSLLKAVVRTVQQPPQLHLIPQSLHHNHKPLLLDLQQQMLQPLITLQQCSTQQMYPSSIVQLCVMAKVMLPYLMLAALNSFVSVPMGWRAIIQSVLTTWCSVIPGACVWRAVYVQRMLITVVREN